MRQGIPVTQPLRGWDDAITLLFSSVRDQPRVAVIDEFPFLVKASPALPSIIQRELGPGGSGGHSTVRLLLCGSAMSVPQSPLFREARYLLAEETEIRDPALYHSVLGAIATGNRTNGGIASFVGRKSADITHPLNVLENCALVVKEPDIFRRGRWTYQVSEPQQDPDRNRRRGTRASGARPPAPAAVTGGGEVGKGDGSPPCRAAGASARPAIWQFRYQSVRPRLLLHRRIP